ncbi:MAG: LytTR family DNA-binding domain-containing protein [Polyangiaceae bacterium]|jgi:DNA-binding LytR/AlgR family response regulator
MLSSTITDSPSRSSAERRTPHTWPTVWDTTTSDRVVARRRTALVILETRDVWAFEAKDRLCFVHSTRGCFDVDLSLLEIEQALGGSFIRIHRRWLVNVANIRELQGGYRGCRLWVASRAAERGTGVRIPVAREAVRSVKRRLLEGTVGLRQKRVV